MTLEDWIEKAEWEGGLFEAVLEYGLSYDDLDETGRQSAFGQELYGCQKALEKLRDLADIYDASCGMVED